MRKRNTRLISKDGTDAIVFAFARGYGQTIAEEILASGQSRKPVPGGEKVFTDWLAP